MTLADRIVVLDKGQIAQVGSPLELYNAPANKFVASFIGSPAMNFVNVRVESREGEAAVVTLPGGGRARVRMRSGRAEGEAELGVRPEHLSIVGANDAAAAFKGVVVIVERLGNATILYVDTPAGSLIVEAKGNLAITSGAEVGIALDEAGGACSAPTARRCEP